MADLNRPNLDIPYHVAIIMDGNRRWAKEHGAKIEEGHRKGFERFKEIVQLCFDKGIKYVTVYAFSTENWQRTEQEVGALMGLMTNAITNEIKSYQGKNIRVNIIGRIKDLPKNLQDEIQKIEKETAGKDEHVLNVAISYGGKEEIVSAIKKIEEKCEEVTEENISKNLYTTGQPNPDLVIRTGGQPRLSNFLMWQTDYSEIYFTDVLWPDFTSKELDKAIDFYTKIKRNFGK